MTQYAIYFHQQWVGDHPAEWFQSRVEPSTAVVRDMEAAGVLVFAGGLEENMADAFSADATSDSSDFDLFVYLVNGTTKTLVGVSASGAADEEVTLTTTAPLNGAQLEIYVHQFGGADGSYTYRGWNVDNTAAGNMTVTPPTRQVTQGTPVTETIAWTGLAAEQSWFGWVGFAGPSGDGEIAFVEVR